MLRTPMIDVLTVSEFASRLKVHRNAVYAAIADKRVFAAQMLGRVVIPKSELKRFKRRQNGIDTWVMRKKQKK